MKKSELAAISMAAVMGLAIASVAGVRLSSHPTRGTASDPATWKPVGYQAVAPTSGVTLDDNGLFKPVMENNIAYLLNTCQLNQMLYYFRKRAGQNPPLSDKPNLGWWEDDLQGACAGRFMMGGGNTLRWITQPELHKRLNELIDGIEACREPNGYIFACPPEQFGESPTKRKPGYQPSYVRGQLVRGLFDAGIVNKKAYDLLRSGADWINHCEYGPNFIDASAGLEGHIASTLPYFTPFGRPEDLQFAEKYYVLDWWMEQLAARQDEAIWKYPLDRPHESEISAFCAYLDHYRATGDKKYLDAMLGAWDLIHDKWQHVGGSIAICEPGLPAGYVQFYPPKSYYLTVLGHTGELCGSGFWIKFNQRFQQLHPMEERYTNEIETSIYNVALANQAGARGIRYHARLEGSKASPTATSTCCEAQGTRIYGSLPEYIYLTAADGLYVNLYEPSTIKWQIDGKAVSLTMKGKFPFDPHVTLKLAMAQPLAMKIRVRVPAWASKDMPIAVNGQEIAVGKRGSYAVLDRTWADRDTIRFTLPMDFLMTQYTGADEIPGHARYALEYGPILLAAVGPLARVYPIPLHIAHDPANLHGWLKPLPDQPLHFAIEGDSEHVFMPYFQVEEQTFTCFPVIKPLRAEKQDYP